MEDWRNIKLGEISKIQTGPFGSQLHQSDYVQEGVPCIMPVNISSSLSLNCEGIAKVSEIDAKRLSRHRVRYGDIVYSRRGDIERCAFIDDRYVGWLCGTGCLKVGDFSETVNPKFIALSLSLPKSRAWLVSNAVGTTMLNLNTSILGDLPLRVPSLKTQTEIVNIIESLDDKIELNNQINHNLEQQAQALYKSWFVDFEPFKDEEFINSELGLIPKGWDVKSLGDIATILKNTINPKKSEGAIFHHYSIPAFDNSESPEEQYGSEILSNKFIITDNTILFSKLNPRIKRVWNVFSAKENAVCSTEFVAYKAKEKKNYAFLYSVIAGDNFYNEIMSKVNGATGSHQRFHPEETLSIKIPYNAYAMMRFENAVLPIIRLMDINKQETASLKAERDSVLPRLLSGELEINKIDC